MDTIAKYALEVFKDNKMTLGIFGLYGVHFAVIDQIVDDGECEPYAQYGLWSSIAFLLAVTYANLKTFDGVSCCQWTLDEDTDRELQGPDAANPLVPKYSTEEYRFGVRKAVRLCSALTIFLALVFASTRNWFGSACNATAWISEHSLDACSVIFFALSALLLLARFKWPMPTKKVLADADKVVAAIQGIHLELPADHLD